MIHYEAAVLDAGFLVILGRGATPEEAFGKVLEGRKYRNTEFYINEVDDGLGVCGVSRDYLTIKFHDDAEWESCFADESLDAELIEKLNNPDKQRAA